MSRFFRHRALVWALMVGAKYGLACEGQPILRHRADDADAEHPLAGQWTQPLLADGSIAVDHDIGGKTWQRMVSREQGTPDGPMASVAFDIVAVDPETERLFGQWRGETWHPNRFIAVQWKIDGDASYFCDLDPDALTLQLAAAAEAADPKSLEFGCLGTPWRLLQKRKRDD